MPNIEKISVALPAEMVAIVRGAVEAEEYSSNSEVIRDALREWSYRRGLRQQGVSELKCLLDEALQDSRPRVPAEEALSQLRAKYQAIKERTGRHEG